MCLISCENSPASPVNIWIFCLLTADTKGSGDIGGFPSTEHGGATDSEGTQLWGQALEEMEAEGWGTLGLGGKVTKDPGLSMTLLVLALKFSCSRQPLRPGPAQLLGHPTC